jgi:anti-sigma regulatory factor (Ser/Thr protein kinase)
VQLVRDPTVVAVARRHAVDVCRGTLDDDQCDSLALAVSELVTNAIRYGRDPITLTVEPTAGTVRVEVTDGDPTPLFVGLPEDLATGRRGLLLVAGVSRSWGWHPTSGGKSVWCEI